MLVWLTCLKFNRTGTQLPSNGGLFPYFRLLGTVYYLCSWRSLTGTTCNLGCQTDLVCSAESEHTSLLSSNGLQTCIQCKLQTSGGPYVNESLKWMNQSCLLQFDDLFFVTASNGIRLHTLNKHFISWTYWMNMARGSTEWGILFMNKWNDWNISFVSCQKWMKMICFVVICWKMY